MKRIETSAVVKRPIEEVWAFRTDLFNVPRLTGMILGIRKTSPGPMGLGTILEGRVAILGFEMTAQGAVTEWDPPHAVAYSFERAGPFRPVTVRQTYEATAEGTRFVGVAEIELGPVLRLLWPILGPLFRRRGDAAEQEMKRLLEAQARQARGGRIE